MQTVDRFGSKSRNPYVPKVTSLFNQCEPSAKIEPPFLAYLESSKKKFFAKYRLKSNLSKHQLKIILYLVVHILPLKIIFLLTYFLYILVRQTTYQEYLVHISRYRRVYQEILVREMWRTKKCWYMELYSTLQKLVG